MSRDPEQGIERDLASGAGASAPSQDGRVRSPLIRTARGHAVLDADGRIVATDAAFRGLAGLGPRSGRELTCCAVLGCRRPAGAALGGCVSELLWAGRRIRDVAIDLPGGPVRLSAQLLGEDGEITLLEIQPAESTAPGDDLGAREPSVRRIRALGRMQIETADGVTSGGWLDQRPGQLLKFLVAERHRVVQVEDIAEALWPSAEFATVNTVRHLIHVLRRRLEPDRRARPTEGGGSCIVSSRGGYALDPALVVIDADEFAGAAEQALEAAAGGEPGAEAALEGALGLYRGDFIGDDPYAAWAQPERERLRALFERVLQALGDAAKARGDVAAATAYVERLADFEPFDSGPQRELIVLSLRAGHRGRALRQYEAFDARMQRVFGERPEFSFEELLRIARS